MPRWCAVVATAMVVPWAHGETTPAVDPAAATAVAKPCAKARKKVAREQRTMAEIAESLARAHAQRASCTSRSACARYDDAIRDTERRQTRQESRLARFEQEVTAACSH